MKILWLLLYTAVLIWSAINPRDYFTWILEVAPAIIGLAVLIATYRCFRLTTLCYWLILLHCSVLMVGGHYSYAEVPLFDYLAELWGWQRNNYDKLGHFMQGFVPALIAREIFMRRGVVNGAGWTNFLAVTFCLAFSALYELLEWGVAVAAGAASEDFLGTQGYIWDTQSDMGFALVGATMAIVLLGRLHSRQIASV